MREIAFGQASAEAVAVIEDHVIVPPGWARALLDARRETGAVVGGSIDNAARSSVVDWAAFLCEYSHCLTPLPVRSDQRAAGQQHHLRPSAAAAIS